MAYADHLRKLLAPLGVYDLSAQSVSGAMLDALGDALDDVWQIMQADLRDAFPQTAEDLAQWERVLPLHGADPDPAVRRAGMLRRISEPEISCSPEEIEQTLSACGLEAELATDGGTVHLRTSLAETAEGAALARALIPAHLEVDWVQE